MQCTTNLRKSLIVGATALLLLVAVAPHGSAQGGAGQATAQFTVGTPSLAPTGPITPDTGVATATVPWTYSITTPAVGPAVGSLSGTAILQWTDPACENGNVVISGSLVQQIPIAGDPGQTTITETGTSSFNIQVTQDAPGEQPIKCTFSGKVLAPFQQVPETDEQSASAFVTADYLGLISANIPTTIKQAGPQKQIRYDIEITNLGNARSTINFNLRGEDPSSGGWNPVPPTQIVLESQAQGGTETTKTVSFLVSTPFKNGWNNKDTTFLLEIQPVSTKDVQKVGQSVNLNVLARVRGVYVPTLEPLLLLGAVVGSALVARLLRE